jgi:hypothetical protein
MTEGKYLSEEVSQNLEREGQIDVGKWFDENHKWAGDNHRLRDVIHMPLTKKSVPFYGYRAMSAKDKYLVFLGAHTKDRDYRIDHDALVLTIEQGDIHERRYEQYLAIKDKKHIRWFMRDKMHGEFLEVRQERVPLYSIFSIAKHIREQK